MEHQTQPKTEIRAFSMNFRANKETREVEGHAAIFNSYADLGYFSEIIEPGAFREAIAVSDIRALFNHDPNHLLGRTKSGTLTVWEDEKGLAYKFTMPDSRTDLIEMMERGDLDASSFAFTIKDAEWRIENGKDVRVIKKVERLYDVSPVTYPAYEDTDVALRSYQEIVQKRQKNTENEDKQARLAAMKREIDLIEAFF